MEMESWNNAWFNQALSLQRQKNAKKNTENRKTRFDSFRIENNCFPI